MAFSAHPRPNQRENRVHNAVVRTRAGLDCTLAYREIPICTGQDDEDNPVIELVEWPFVLPHLLVTWLMS